MACDRGGVAPDNPYQGGVESVCPGVPKGLNAPNFVGPNIVDQTSDEQTSVVQFNVAGSFYLGDGANPLWSISGQPGNAFILQDGTVAGVLTEDIATDTDYSVTVTYSTSAGSASSNTFNWRVNEVAVLTPVAGGFSIANPGNTLVADNIQCSFQNADQYVLTKSATPPLWNDPGAVPIANITTESVTLSAYQVSEAWYIYPIDTATQQVGLSELDAVTAYDLIAPTPPSDFLMSPGSDPSTQFIHTWSGEQDDQSGIDRVDLVDGYTLDVIVSDATSGVVESGLDPDTSYRRAVRVYDNVGRSILSNMDTKSTSAGSPNLFSEVYADWIASGGIWVADGSSAGTYSTGGIPIANGADLYQDIVGSLIAGHTYEMTVTVVSMASGVLRPVLGGAVYGESITAPGVDIVRTIDWDGSSTFPFCGLTTIASGGTGFNGAVQASDGTGGTGIKLVDLGVTP